MNSPVSLHLQTFLVVARTRSFSAAARELGVSRSAVSQAVRQFEKELGVTLVTRTTRSVSLTETGRRLLDTAGPAVGQVQAALKALSARPGEMVGRLRLTVPRAAAHFMVARVLPVFREKHPRIEVELVFDDQRVDIVAGGFDAGIRLSEFLERDMIGVRVTEAFRFVVVGSPRYLDARGTPERPEDLLHHECLTFRSGATGALYAWELERGRRTWRVPVRGSVVVNDGLMCVELAAQGLGLAYAMEPLVKDRLGNGLLRRVLEPFAPTVPGFFLYYPRRARSAGPLRLLVETIQSLSRTTSARPRARP